jgi:heat shock protein 1/8
MLLTVFFSPIIQKLYGTASGAPGGPGSGASGFPGGAPGGFPGAPEDGPSVEEVD